MTKTYSMKGKRIGGIVEIPTKNVRLKCPVHGKVGVKPAYDDFLNKMSGISCEKCPTITKENYKEY